MADRRIPTSASILFLFLPAFFILGLILIPIGIFFQRRKLIAKGELPSIYPEVNFNDPMFRHALNFVIIATFINFVIVGVASYRGVAYMDTPGFCGAACHVPMQPQWVAYQHSPHSHVDCTECHVGSGAANYVHAKMAGMKQLVGVTFNTFPRPILAPLSELRPARATCEECHAPKRYIGDKLLVKTTFASDEKNAMTKTMLVLHLGGVDSLSHLSGIHGHHLTNIQYTVHRQRKPDHPLRQCPRPQRHLHRVHQHRLQRAPSKASSAPWIAWTATTRQPTPIQTAEDAVDESMANGTPDPALPFVHKQGLLLIQAKYGSQEEAATKIKAGLESFYRSQYPAIWSAHQAQVDQAADVLTTIYKQNVFPEMKVTWGTYPNNIGHNNFPGCFRCHDGNHTTKDGKTITNDCAACHNLLAVDEANPKLLSEINFQ